MSGLFLSDGHLGWPFFNILVFSMVSLLVADLVWRLVVVRASVLVPAVLILWAVGVCAIGFV